LAWVTASSTVWPVRVRVAAHNLVGLVLGVALVVTVVHGEGTTTSVDDTDDQGFGPTAGAKASRM
jgi:hypothetical protein